MRPYWGMPVEAWTAADPEFWKANPMPAVVQHMAGLVDGGVRHEDPTSPT